VSEILPFPATFLRMTGHKNAGPTGYAYGRGWSVGDLPASGLLQVRVVGREDRDSLGDPAAPLPIPVCAIIVQRERGVIIPVNKKILLTLSGENKRQGTRMSILRSQARYNISRRGYHRAAGSGTVSRSAFPAKGKELVLPRHRDRRKKVSFLLSFPGRR
jgi:hypothetical protein